MPPHTIRALPHSALALVAVFAASACAPTQVQPSHAEHPMTCPSATPPTPTAPARQLDPVAARAVEIVKGIHGDKRDDVYATFGEEFRRAIPIEKFRAVEQEVDATDGKLLEATYADEETGTSGVRTIRVVAFFERGAELYTVWLDDKTVLRGLRVAPLAPHPREDATVGPADDYVAKRTYALPARGAWDVHNGGRAASGNAHVGNPQQWYAFDLVQKGADGKTHTGDGKKNEDYLAFGQPVRAPADGTVVAIVDGVGDNAPGEENVYVAPGNYVVIDHGDGEYSFLAHIERGSFVVKTGAHVKAGDVLAKVGNSGNSSEPHIHWHIGTDARLEKGHGLPIRFVPLRVNGKSVDAPAPARDDRLEPRAS